MWVTKRKIPPFNVHAYDVKYIVAIIKYISESYREKRKVRDILLAIKLEDFIDVDS